MRIKGVPSLFWVQHDAFDKMERRLRHEYGISIYERGDFCGYIKKRAKTDRSVDSAHIDEREVIYRDNR